MDNIIKFWEKRICGRTRLWRPIYDDIKNVYLNQIDKENLIIKLLILTDGDDNMSEGKFNGIDGMKHLIDELEKVSKALRFCIYIIGLSLSKEIEEKY